jgi:hypothetical protein
LPRGPNVNKLFLTTIEPSGWSNAGTMLYRTSAVLIALLMLQLPASGKVFNNQDAVFLNPIVQDFLEAERAVSSIKSGTADPRRTYECLRTLQEGLENVERAFPELRNLVSISIEMIHPTDEQVVNKLILMQILFVSDVLSSSRGSVNDVMKRCTSTTDVIAQATYALNLFTRVESATDKIGARLK